MDERHELVRERLMKLQTCAVGDVLDEMGFKDQVLSDEISALDRSMKVAGPAFCIRGHSNPGSTLEVTDRSTVNVGYEMFRQMYPGCVVVMDTGGHYLGGPWGENSAVSARARGSVGIVMDGATRDSLELVEMSWPTFSRGVTPARVEGRWRQVSFGEPVALPGRTTKEVVIAPGDFILGDADGVVVIPHSVIGETLVAAEDCAAVELLMRDELESGVDRETVYATHDRYGVGRAFVQMKNGRGAQRTS